MQRSWLRRTAFIFAICLSFFASTIHGQKPGSWYWGDGDGTGSIGGPDLNVLLQVIGDPGIDDTTIYSGYPQSRFRQDLDGSGSIAGPDLNVLYPWLATPRSGPAPK